MSHSDVIIIGASVAGATAASILGRAGLRVALLDKAKFPRRKPCGEGLSARGIAVLERNGLWPKPGSLPIYPYSGFNLSVNGRSRVLEPVFGAGVTLQREHFDSYLLQSAAACSRVKFFEGVCVKSVGPDVTTRFGNDSISAKYIVIADGGRSKTASMINASSRRTGPARAGLTATFRGSFSGPAKLVQIVIERSHEIYCTPLPGQRLNISILAPFPAKQNLRQLILDEALLRRVFELNSFSGELELAPLGRAPIGNVSRHTSRESVFLIGDALEEFDPIGGMGMSHALCSGELAAQAILRIEGGKFSPCAARAWYLRERERVASPLRLFTNIAYRALRGSVRIPAMIDLLASPFASLLGQAIFQREVNT